MLPKVTQLEIQSENEQSGIEEENRQNTGGSFLYDFDQGDFVLRDGKLVPVEGLEALKVWIEKTLRTEKFKFDVYEGTEYGVQIEDLIGTSYPQSFIESELQREITNVLVEHPSINNVTNWSFQHDGSSLIVSFRIQSEYGPEEMEVPVNG